MNCWNHNASDVCASGVCANCEKTIYYGHGVELCHGCSLKLNQCQVCRRGPGWNPEEVIGQIQEKITKLEQNMKNNKLFVDNYVRNINKCKVVIDKIKAGTISSHAQVRACM